MSVFTDIGTRALRQTSRRLCQCSLCGEPKRPAEMQPSRSWCRRCQRVVGRPRARPHRKGSPSDAPRPRLRVARTQNRLRCEHCGKFLLRRGNTRFCNNECKYAFGRAIRGKSPLRTVDAIHKFPTEGK